MIKICVNFMKPKKEICINCKSTGANRCFLSGFIKIKS